MLSRIGPLVLVPFAFAAACAVAETQHVAWDVDRDALLADLRVLSADEMEGRRTGTPGAEKARAFVVERFRASGLEPIGESYERAFTLPVGQNGDAAPGMGVNVAGLIAGRATPDRYIVVTAHYDHLGGRGARIFNGADDNASGTAALFAVGRHFKAHPPANSLLVAALDGEEDGLLGASAFVSSPPVPLEAVVLNVNIDMIGREPGNLLFAVGTHQYPFLKPYIDQVAARASVTLRTGHDDPARVDVEDWTRDSDHFAFHQRGIPFIYFGVEDFAEHHQMTDDYETITYDFYVRAVETILDALSVFDANLGRIAEHRAAR